jgi:3-oxoacyl-[acyl-carrier-protein] synthase-3
LGYQAALGALEVAGFSPEEIDLIVVATSTPDDIFPSAAVKIQAYLGAKKAFAFDVQAVCSGFLYALSTAEHYLRSGRYHKALVVGAEVVSRIMDWKDRSTAVLFGDGAGAVVLSADDSRRQGELLSTHLYSDGSHYEALCARHEISETSHGKIYMNGREVFRHAIQKMIQSIEIALEYNKLAPEDIQWLIPHQANRRIIEPVCEHFSLPLTQAIITLDQHANTFAASIPLALSSIQPQDMFKKDDMILFSAMGGGFTWGSAVIRW